MRQTEDREKWELTAALEELRKAAQEHRRRKEAARHPSMLRHMLDGARALIAGLEREWRAVGRSRSWARPMSRSLSLPSSLPWRSPPQSRKEP